MALLNVTPFDREYYAKHIRPYLPERFIDIHAHVWLEAFHRKDAMRSGSQNWPRLVARDNSAEDLIETNRLLFPENTIIPVLYGDPIVTIDRKRNNAYVAEKAKAFGCPALYLSHPSQKPEELEQEVLASPVYRGIKVYLQFAPAYLPDDEIRIFDFLPKEHLAVCDRHGWFVQVHIPRSKRLADPVNYRQLLEIEENYPHLTLSVAHLGRAYANEDLGDALEFLKHTKNTVWDITANTNDWVMEQVLRYFGPERMVYGSDFPVFRMKARRVVENGIYINEIPKGTFPIDSICGDRHMREIDFPEAERITFFIYEEIRACITACRRLGLGKDAVEKIFWSNAAKLFGLL